MSKKHLKLTKFGELEFRLDLDNNYFGKIKAIPNNDGTGYAVIYGQSISALSGPPMTREIYLESIKNPRDLESIARTHSKKIAQANNYSLKNKDNLSAKNYLTEDEKMLERARDPKRLKHFAKITKEILSKPSKSF